MSRILVLNGPNLNMLGTREPEIYGKESLDDIETLCHKKASELSLEIDFRQSNAEAELIEWIQQDGNQFDGVIINGAGFTHTSVALMDALLLLTVPVIEVHLSNVYRREEFRHHSYISKAAKGVICGFGSAGYVLALQSLAK